MPIVTLVSLSAPHYRKRIFELLESELGTSFIFGEDDNIKQLDPKQFIDARTVPLDYIAVDKVYKMPKVIKSVKSSDIVIDDMGIMCLTSWLNLVISKFRNRKVYLWTHGWYGREGFLKKILKRLYSGLADGTLLYGNYARRLMEKNGLNPNKLHVIHNSLDYDNQLLIRAKLINSDIYRTHFGNPAPILIFIGRLTEVKRIDMLLDALSKLKKRGRDYNLVIVGAGPMGDDLISQANKLGIHKNVWFYGASYDENENGILLYNADLCIAPGNIGLTAIHAMTYGCPCISHDNFPMQMPEFEAIVDGQTGSFFNHNSIGSLCDSIEAWFNSENYDRAAIRENCYREIEMNWNPHNQIKIIKKILNNECATNNQEMYS